MGLEKAQKSTDKSSESQGNGVSSVLLFCAVRTYLSAALFGGRPDRNNACVRRPAFYVSSQVSWAVVLTDTPLETIDHSRSLL